MVCREVVNLLFWRGTAAADNDSIVFPDARKERKEEERKGEKRKEEEVEEEFFNFFRSLPLSL